MNSRDAAYEQEMQILIQVTAAEAAAAEASRDGKEPLVDLPTAMNGQAPDSREGDTIPEPEPEIVSGRRKRKRTDEERYVGSPRSTTLQKTDNHASAATHRSAHDPRQ